MLLDRNAKHPSLSSAIQVRFVLQLWDYGTVNDLSPLNLQDSKLLEGGNATGVRQSRGLSPARNFCPTSVCNVMPPFNLVGWNGMYVFFVINVRMV